MTKWGKKYKVLSNILHKYIYENCLYSHLYLQLKNIFTFKKSSTFPNLLIKKPGNWFATVKMWKKHRKEKKIKKRICDFTYKFTLGQFSVPTCANQPLGFSVRRTSTLNGLFQTIKMLMGYTIYQLKHSVLFHLKFENLKLFVNY